MARPPPSSTRFPYTTLFRSTEALLLCARLLRGEPAGDYGRRILEPLAAASGEELTDALGVVVWAPLVDRKSTRLNSSHSSTSYAVFCLKKKSAITTAASPPS